MVMIWNKKSLSEALSIDVTELDGAGAVCYNSSDVKKGDIFVAMPANALPTIKGTKDSHIYVKDALERGAVLAIVEHDIDGVDKNKLLIVPNSFDALQKMASYKRAKSKAKFICITGSAGKTSTKEALALALSHFSPTFANPGTFNNELGVPLTLASMPDDAKYVVMEVGMNHAGEISPLMSQIMPDIVMINNILPVHLENFDSLDGIADAKLEILDGLKHGGTAIFNADSEYYDYCCTKAIKKGAGKILGFGNQNADCQLVEYSFDGLLSHVEALIGKHKISFTTKVAGRHRVLNLIAVLTVCYALDLDINEAAKAFKKAIPPKGRGEMHEVSFNGHKCVVIDDAYNAGPVSTIASLHHLRDLDHSYKVIILANMMELGPEEIEYHKSLLPHIISAGVKRVYTSGHLMYELHKVIPDDIWKKHFNSYRDIEEDLDNIVDRDMMILLKGSKSQKLSHIVDVLINKENQ